MEEVVPFGISGLDEALSGGIPCGSVVLISGGAGTGKSTICLHYVSAGASKGERCLYITTEQKESDLCRQAQAFGLKLDEQIESGLVRVFFVDILSEDGIFSSIRQAVKDFSPKRIVVDSLSTFSEYASTTDLARDLLLKRGGVASRSIDEISPRSMSERTLTKRMLASLISEIRSFNTTAILTSELPEKGDKLSSDGISEFLADGVVLLYYWDIGSVEQHALKIRKMRYTKHETTPLLYELGDTGIEIKKEQL